MTGEQDFRTPIKEAEQLITKVDNILAWFERYREKADEPDSE